MTKRRDVLMGLAAVPVLMSSARLPAAEQPATGGAASLFIDIIGRPLTPVSFAGANRRTGRRRDRY